jgi:SOS-response transcriptional repressor LexA
MENLELPDGGGELSNGIGDRIIQVRSKQTQQSFANSIKIAKSTLLRYERGERLPDSEVIARICETHNIDYTWLITGRGSPTEAERYTPIPQYDIAASAGSGAILDDNPDVEMVMVDKHWLEEQFHVNPENVSLIFVRGDSMHPTLNHGDLLLVSNKSESLMDGIYVLRYEGFLHVKRIQRQPISKLRITSDNPAYESFTVNLLEEEVDFQVIGKVIWTIRPMNN